MPDGVIDGTPERCWRVAGNIPWPLPLTCQERMIHVPASSALVSKTTVAPHKDRLGGESGVGTRYGCQHS